MHRYFLIPFIGFFLIISIIMIYLQFVNEDWKFLVPKIKLPDSCNNNNEVEFVIHESDINQNRSFKDEKDVYNGNQFNPIFLLPCEREDRLYDVNKNIEASLLAINNWFEKKNK